MKFLKKLFLPLVVSWFLMTVLVDMVAIPAVFRNISNISEAGRVGMMVFGRFNYFEVFFALIILNISIIHFAKNKVKKFLIIALPLFILSLVYTFKLTPAITYYATIGDQPNLTYFHQIYKTLDSIKLITLLVFAGIILVHEIKEEV